MKLSGKDDGNINYSRRGFIKMAGTGMPVFLFPQYLTSFMTDSCGSKGLFGSGGPTERNSLFDWIGDSTNTLLYFHPADVKEYPLYAMPIGNGSLGAMFSGHPKYERIIINHDRLRPAFYKEGEKIVSDYLPLVRNLFLDKKYEVAQEVFNNMQLESGGQRKLNNYHQICDLILEMDGADTSLNYKRLLDMQYGVGKVSYSNGGTNYVKTYFSSVPDDTIVINIAASKPKSINCTISLGRLPFESCMLNALAEGNSMKLRGEYLEGTCFEAFVTLTNKGKGGIIKPEFRSYSGIGEVEKQQKGKLVSLSVQNADELTILTKVKVFNKLSGEISSNEIKPVVYDNNDLLERHVRDYQEKFSRASLNLTTEENKNKPASVAQLIEQARNGNVSTCLFELIFQMGRYTLLSSSQADSLPANLQGLWSMGYSPTWNCRYQLDINLQMCYWLANSANLDECNYPLFDFLEELVPAAIKRSNDLYNCRGISLPVGIDGTNVRYPSCSETQCVAGWLAHHFWEHYQYTLDKEFLANRAYPFMLEAGVFFEDFLFKDEQGKYIVFPSASPENRPEKFSGRLTMNATIDLAVVVELFNNLISASHILNVDVQKRKKWQKILKDLPDWPIGKDGTLLEWADNDVNENQAHRHLSHLYPLFPGSLFDIEKTPDLITCAVKAIKKREAAFLEDACGWSYAWLVALYARAGMAEDAYRNLVIYAKGFITDDNFLSTISDLSGLGLGRIRHGNLIQIEAGLGISAAIAEMLIQSHNGLIRILPALPNCWDNGSVRGLKARGNYEIDIIWESGYINKVIIKSSSESICKIKFYHDFNGKMKFRTNKKEINAQLKKEGDNIFVFKTGLNAEYVFYKE